MHMFEKWVYDHLNPLNNNAGDSHLEKEGIVDSYLRIALGFESSFLDGFGR